MPEVFAAGKFCLISYGADGHFQNGHFAGALGTGCVPVVTARGQHLPFQNKIDWAGVVIRMLPDDITNDLIPFLTKYSFEDWIEARDRGLFIFNKFFSSVKAVGEGI